MNSNDIKAGRMYSWVYQPSAEQWSKNNLNKGGRAGMAPNPLYGRVSVRKVKCGQAGSMEMYQRKALELDPNYQPSADRTPTMEATENPSLFRSLSTGGFQVLIIGSRTTKEEFFVDGRLATEDEMAIIRLYEKASKPRDPTKVKVEFPYLENLANVD